MFIFGCAPLLREGFLDLWGTGLFVAVCWLFIAVASLLVTTRLEGTQASVVVVHWLSCSESCGIFPNPALAGRFLTTGPPGKSSRHFLKTVNWWGKVGGMEP